LRIQLDGVAYLILSHGSSSELAWKDDADFAAYLSILKTYQDRYGFTLFAYCLMPDQALVCLEPKPGTSLSTIMHDVTVRYTKAYNKRYGRSGQLFQQRFKAVVVEKSSALLAVSAYLHAHPARCGLNADIAQYRFSSYACYRADEAPMNASQPSVERQAVLSLLPGERTPAAYEQYVRRFSDAEAEAIRRGLQRGVLGSEETVRVVKARGVRTVASPILMAAPVAAPRLLAQRPSPVIAGSLMAIVSVCVLSVLLLNQRVAWLGQLIQRVGQQPSTAHTSYSLAVQVNGAARPTSLEGPEWGIRLAPVAIEQRADAQTDRLTFTKTELTSAQLSAQGVLSSHYAMKTQSDGDGVWEAMQTGPRGEVIWWQGRWQGQIMRGLVTRQTAGGSPQRFTFVGLARTSSTPRSET